MNVLPHDCSSFSSGAFTLCLCWRAWMHFADIRGNNNNIYNEEWRLRHHTTYKDIKTSALETLIPSNLPQPAGTMSQNSVSFQSKCTRFSVNVFSVVLNVFIYHRSKFLCRCALRLAEAAVRTAESLPTFHRRLKKPSIQRRTSHWGRLSVTPDTWRILWTNFLSSPQIEI